MGGKVGRVVKNNFGHMDKSKVGQDQGWEVRMTGVGGSGGGGNGDNCTLKKCEKI